MREAANGFVSRIFFVKFFEFRTGASEGE